MLDAANVTPIPDELTSNTSATFARAIELYTAGKAPDAYPLFVAVVTEDRKHVGAWYYIGMICTATENLRQLAPPWRSPTTFTPTKFTF